jgi:hypothetical protein
MPDGMLKKAVKKAIAEQKRVETSFARLPKKEQAAFIEEWKAQLAPPNWFIVTHIRGKLVILEQGYDGRMDSMSVPKTPRKQTR